MLSNRDFRGAEVGRFRRPLCTPCARASTRKKNWEARTTPPPQACQATSRWGEPVRLGAGWGEGTVFGFDRKKRREQIAAGLPKLGNRLAQGSARGC